MIPIEDIKPYDNNPKLHPESQVDKIAQSIDAFGWDVPLVLDKMKVIVKGHGRYLAARKLGLKEVPCIITDLPPEKIQAARIADNKISESEWDEAILKLEMESLKLEDFDLDLTGFDEDELELILASQNEEVVPPNDFKSYDENLETSYQCPKCQYEWSGKPK